MNINGYVIAVLCIGLAGCVTTTGGRIQPEADMQAAAELNLNLGVNYLRQGKLDEAMYKLEKSVKDDPRNPTTYRVLALVYDRLGDPDSAERNYRAAVRIGQKDADALNELGVFLCRRANGRGPTVDEALNLFNQALTIPLYKNRYLIYTNAGTCAAQSRPVIAEDYLRNALALNPVFPEALYQMASISFDLNNYLPARAFLERYLAVSQPLPEVLMLGHRVEQALGDQNAAARYSAKLINQFPESVQAQQLLSAQRDEG